MVTTLSVYDINDYIKADSTLQTIAGKTMSIYPIQGAQDAAAPYMVYFFSPNIPSVEAWWLRRDAVLYVVYDTDIDRLFRIQERLIEMLSKGDRINDPGGKVGTDVQLHSTVFRGASGAIAAERDGWFFTELEFTILNTPR